MQMRAEVTQECSGRILYGGWGKQSARFYLEGDHQLIVLDIPREELPALFALVHRAMIEGIGTDVDHGPSCALCQEAKAQR